ncbi:MAG: hypothetical protein KJO79_00795 [Verrucomicrobiae bacterium]|nr:hypothetical protein [Verrucomicrobiae bacterium]NNJ85681.1 hypothetical protein [Akkermansiaceae bacterium]
MKRIQMTLLALVFSFAPVSGADEMIPGPGLEALGGLAGLGCYNGYTALKHIAKVDPQNAEHLKAIAMDAGGIMGGADAMVKMLEKVLPVVPVAEKETMRTLINMNKLLVDEAKFLVEYLKAKNTGQGFNEAKQKFETAKAKLADSLTKNLGMPAEILK